MKKEYIVLQESESDCGACCLLSIIKYYKGFVPLEIIKCDTFTTKEGTSFLNLKEAGEKYGFEVKGYSAKSLQAYNFPYIAQLKIQDGVYHFVVVYKVLQNRVVCMDPSSGAKKYSLDEFFQLYNGYILCFNPINKIIKYQKNQKLAKNIKTLLKENLMHLFFILIISIMSIVFSLYNNHLIRYITIENKSKYMHIFVFLLLIVALLNYAKNLILAHLNKKYSYSLENNYMSHVFKLPLKNLQLKSSGEVISKITDLDYINVFFSKEIINLIISILFTIAVTIILYVYNHIVTLLLLMITAMYLLLLILFNKKIYYLYLDKIDGESKYMNNLVEYITKIETIKNLSREEFFLNKIREKLKNKNYNNYLLEKILNRIELINNLYSSICFIVIICLSYYLNNSLETVFIYILYFNYFSSNIEYFAKLIPSIMYLKGIFFKVNGLFYLEEEIVNNNLYESIDSIAIKNMSYQISHTKILDNFNMKIHRNEKILLVGPNGSGKSTLLNILNGNLKDYKGSFTINNEIVSEPVKNQIYLSSQNDCLFIDTVLNNIVLDKKYNKEKLLIISNILGLDKIVSKKSNYYNTIIKDNFSGGEKEIIMLARALYQDYNIILFDESFKEINYLTRKKIINNINRYYKDKTIIYVSHNIEEVRFDKTIKLIARKDNNANG